MRALFFFLKSSQTSRGSDAKKRQQPPAKISPATLGLVGQTVDDKYPTPWEQTIPSRDRHMCVTWVE